MRVLKRPNNSIHLFFLLIFTSSICNTYGQKDWRLKIEDEWFHKYGIQGLKVGDKIPDIDLGHVLNNYTGKTKWSQFKGQLVILDFWHTQCSNCIEAFPKMEKLQQKYGNKIQIILVNQFESAKTLERKIPKLYAGKFNMPNLPSIVPDNDYDGSWEEFQKNTYFRIFPQRGVPHHVWIDSNGTIIVSGPAMNTYEDKIDDYFNGKSIFNLNAISTVPSLAHDKVNSYYEILSNENMPKVNFGFIITPFNNFLNGYNKTTLFEVIDSAGKTRRITSINEDVIQHYFRLFKEDLNSFRDSSVYASVNDWHFISFPEDTLSYTSYFLQSKGGQIIRDKEFIQSRYCVEQIVPIDYPKEKQAIDMLNEMNKYFGHRLGVNAKLVKKDMVCYVLKKTSKVTHDSKKLIVKEALLNYSELNIGDRHSLGKNDDNLKQVIERFILQNPELEKEIDNNGSAGRPSVIVNETGWDIGKSINFSLPNKLQAKNIQEFRIILQRYGFELKEAIRKFNFLEIRKIDSLVY